MADSDIITKEVNGTMSRKYKWRGDKRVEKDILDGFADINSREELIQLEIEEFGIWTTALSTVLTLVLKKVISSTVPA